MARIIACISQRVGALAAINRQRPKKCIRGVCRMHMQIAKQDLLIRVAPATGGDGGLLLNAGLHQNIAALGAFNLARTTVLPEPALLRAQHIHRNDTQH